MQRADLEELLSREDARVDWKAGGDPETIVRTLAAFANDLEQQGGGYVLCGVAERSPEPGGFPRPELRGLDHDKLRELKNKVLTRCRKNLEPPLTPSPYELDVSDDRRVLVFEVVSAQSIVMVNHHGVRQT